MRSFHIRTLGFAAAICGVWPLTVSAQELHARQEPPTLTISSRIVVLDVVVTDSKGNLRTDLKQEDFKITEAGQPVVIRSFEPPSVHMQPPPHPIESTDDLNRYAPQSPVDIIVLDELNTKFEDMAYVRYSVNKYLKAQPEKLSTPTMLLAVDHDNVTVLRDYTLDRAAIFSALEHHLTAYPFHLQIAFNPIRQLASSLGALEQVAAATSGHPGHKNLIWIGKGFPGIDLTSDSIDPQDAAQLTAAVQGVVDRLRDQRITLDTIDPTPLSSSIQSTSNDASSTGDDDGVSAPDPFAGDINFNSLAPQTGGKAYFSRNDIDRELAQTVREGNAFYTISYRPPVTSADAQQPFRGIRVRFADKGLRATYRTGYYAQPAQAPPVSSARVQYDLYAAETGTLSYTGLTVAAGLKPGSDHTYVMVVPASQLVWLHGAPGTASDSIQSAKVTLVATSLDKKGAMLERVTHEITARRSEAAAAAAPPDAVAKFEIEITPGSKATRLRFVIRGSDGRIGTADIDPHTNK